MVAAVPRDALSDVLTAVHRSGYGHRSRVIDPQRGDVVGQFVRAGVAVPEHMDVDAHNDVLLVISAAARAATATALVLSQGATRAWLTDRPVTPTSPLGGGFRPRGSRRPVPPPFVSGDLTVD